MKRFVADAAVKEAPHRHAVQPFLRFGGALFVDLHAIGHAVVSRGQRPQGEPFPAAGIKHIGGYPRRKRDSPRDMLHVQRIGGIVAHFDAVHQPADHGCAGGLRLRQFGGKGRQDIRQLLIVRRHDRKGGKLGAQRRRDCREFFLTQFQKAQSGLPHQGGHPSALFEDQVVDLFCLRLVGLQVFVQTPSVHRQDVRQRRKGPAKFGKLFQCIITGRVRLLHGGPPCCGPSLKVFLKSRHKKRSSYQML